MTGQRTAGAVLRRAEMDALTDNRLRAEEAGDSQAPTG